MSVTDVEKELKDLRKRQKAIEKKIKQLDGTSIIEKGMAKWEKISNVKYACEKLIRDAKLGSDFNSLLKLHKWPNYYIYQHPLKKQLKTDDINEEWVQYFIGNIPHDPKDTGKMDRYGSWQEKGEKGLTILRETAAKTRMGAWKRAKKKQQQVENLFKYGKTKQEREKIGPQGQLSDAQKSLQALATTGLPVPTEIINKKVATKKKVSKKVATRK